MVICLLTCESIPSTQNSKNRAPSVAARDERDWIRGYPPSQFAWFDFYYNVVFVELFIYVETACTIFHPLAKELQDDINLRALTNIAYNMKVFLTFWTYIYIYITILIDAYAFSLISLAIYI